eukprot:scaffold6088_cov128-Isochrysis_galbana.AAC.3
MCGTRTSPVPCTDSIAHRESASLPAAQGASSRLPWAAPTSTSRRTGHAPAAPYRTAYVRAASPAAPWPMIARTNKAGCCARRKPKTTAISSAAVSISWFLLARRSAPGEPLSPAPACWREVGQKASERKCNVG